MTDAVREAFERWMSEDWKWPDAVAHRYGHYVLAQTESAWKAWQAALSEQPAHPAPVERVTLSERRITEIVRSVVSSTERPIGMVAYGELVARAVIAEYERANGISESASGCRARQIGPDKWVCDCGGQPCIPFGIGKGEQA